MMKLIVAFFAALSFASFSFARDIVNERLSSDYGKSLPYYKIGGTKGTMNLQISDGKLYALENGGLSIYDLSDKFAPKLLGRVGGMGAVRQLRISGKTAFISARESGLWSVDVSNPKSPKIISNFASIELATGLDIAGGLAVLGVRVFGVQCVDVSNPAEMKQVSSIITNESQSVAYRNGLIFSGDWGAGEVTIIDAADLANLKTVSKFKLDGYGDGIDIRGKYLYASTGHNKKSGPKKLRKANGHALEIFDISDIKNPRRLSRTQFPPAYFRYADYWAPVVCGDYVFAVDTINGLFVVDARDKSAPRIVGNVVLPKVAPDDHSVFFNYPEIQNADTPYGDPVTSVAVGDGVIYISGQTTGIFAVRLPDIAKSAAAVGQGVAPVLPEKIDFSQRGFISSGAERVNPIRAVAIDGDTAYAANVYGGVKIFKLSENKIEHVGTIKAPCAYDVSYSEGRLAVAQGLLGTAIYKIANGGGAELLCTIKGGFSRYARIFDGTNIVVEYGGGIARFFDISDPKSPREVFQKKVGHILYNDFGSSGLVSGRYWNLNCHSRGCWIFDISKNSVKNVYEEYTSVNSQTGGTCVFGGRFLISFRGGYSFIDPVSPAPLADKKPLDFARIASLESADFGGKKVYEGLMDSDGKTSVAFSNRICKNCRVYDFSDENSPKLLRAYSLTANPDKPAFWRGRLVLPCGYAGLLLEK